MKASTVKYIEVPESVVIYVCLKFCAMLALQIVAKTYFLKEHYIHDLGGSSKII
jgi:hypothetical protein